MYDYLETCWHLQSSSPELNTLTWLPQSGFVYELMCKNLPCEQLCLRRWNSFPLWFHPRATLYVCAFLSCCCYRCCSLNPALPSELFGVVSIFTSDADMQTDWATPVVFTCCFLESGGFIFDDSQIWEYMFFTHKCVTWNKWKIYEGNLKRLETDMIHNIHVFVNKQFDS